MPRKAQSQWDFGELFGPQQTRQVLTVSEVTLRVKRLLEQQLGALWVQGEISNLRLQPSGHIYFTLKDAGAQLACVLFRGEPGIPRDLLADGRQVVVRGDFTVYEARGLYQMVVRALEPLGWGALQAAFERLKQKLHAEGLFDAARKRPLPRFVYRVGVVTSPTAAAFRDLLSVWQRRFPGMEIMLAPCRVQGDGAAGEIAAAIALLNQYHAAQPPARRLHALLITRGGGSLEDLWAFNEEAVARAIFHSQVPVVSAVGHEIDFTISDFVADVRAPTPSVAAELLSEGMFQARQRLPQHLRLLRRSVFKQLQREREILRHWEARLQSHHPRRHLEQQSQRLDDEMERLRRVTRRQMLHQRQRMTRLLQSVQRLRPARLVQRRAEHLQGLTRLLQERARRRLQERRVQFRHQLERLRLLSPQNTLVRGYSITQDAETGRALRRMEEAAPGRRVITILAQGQLISRVEEVRPESLPEPPPAAGT